MRHHSARENAGPAASQRIPVGGSGPERETALSVFFSVGRLHITVIASLGLLTFGWLFTGRYLWVLTAVCWLDWYVVNLINRTVDINEDSANTITGTGFVYRNRKALLALGLALLSGSLVGVHLLRPEITFPRVAFHLLGAFYNWPILPGRRRIKNLYFWKNSASAMGFMITLFGYPLALAGWSHASSTFPPGITWQGIIFTGVFFFLFEVSYEVIYDMRDVKGDALAGVRTYPVVHGMSTAVHVVDGLLLGSMAVLFAGYLTGVVPWRIFIMIVVPAIQMGFYKHALRRGGISTGDCTGMTWMGAGLIVVYHLWVLAGLPGVGL
jgi:4-hydroxybenzoate polyprenyltransferase